MQETAYGLRVEVPLAYEAAVARATDALKAEGFGVLTTIDVQATLKAKLDRDFRKYV
ncbi:MAG: ABC transporter ATP-binding protein, partial [Vicinamibacterales bacterium]